MHNIPLQLYVPQFRKFEHQFNNTKIKKLIDEMPPDIKGFARLSYKKKIQEKVNILNHRKTVIAFHKSRGYLELLHRFEKLNQKRTSIDEGNITAFWKTVSGKRSYYYVREGSCTKRVAAIVASDLAKRHKQTKKPVNRST